MQKLNRFILVAIVASLVVVAGCGDDDDSSGDSTTASADAPDVPFVGSPENDVATELPEPKPEDLTIGLLNPLASTEVLRVMFDGAQAQVEELGGKSIEYDAQVNPDRQISQFEQLLNQNVDAIVVVSIAAPDLLAPLLQQAQQQGVPVVGLDAFTGDPGPLPGFATDVWQQRDRMVYLEVKTAAEMLGEGAKVGQIGYAPPVPIFEFAEARTEYWADKFGLDIVGKVEAPADSVASGQQVAVELLAQNPDIVGVLGYNDEPAIGASLAARAAGNDDLKTFGACCGLSLGRSGLESGRLTATVAFDGDTYGRQGVIAAYDAVQGAKLPPEVLAGDLVVLTKDNLDEVEE